MSLLSMPVGTGTVLSQLALSIAQIGARRLSILPTFTPAPEYEPFVLQQAGGMLPSGIGGVKVVGSDVLASLMHEHEPSDLLLLLDPRHWAVHGLDLANIVSQSDGTYGAVHGVAVGSANEDAKEYVHCDDNGQVRRISRYYDQVTYLKIDAIAYSLVPLASCERLPLESLGQFRAALSARGVLSRDVPVSCAIVDLTQEDGLLTLNEQRALAAVREGASGYTQPEEGMLAGKRCRIHPSSRIVGPVIIQDDVTIEAGVSVLGPAVLGAGCTVRRGAMVAQSVLARGATVLSDAVVRQRVGAGNCKGDESSEPGGNGQLVERLEPIQSQGVRLGADASAVRDVRVGQLIYPTIKLVIDVCLAFISLIVLIPLFVVVALAIKLESRGPIFFGHRREGKDGKVFRCLKFRTMCHDAHLKQRELYSTNALDGPQFKIHNDPRVTRVGAWLRATNIDELPQLINVLFGQMSLVGPRPSPFRENQICVPWRRARLSVRPGITGLWQICRDQRSEGDFHQWIRYDIMYVRHMSVWLDLKIVLATIVTLGGLWMVRPTWLVNNDRAFSKPRRAGARRPSGSNGSGIAAAAKAAAGE